MFHKIPLFRKITRGAIDNKVEQLMMPLKCSSTFCYNCESRRPKIVAAEWTVMDALAGTNDTDETGFADEGDMEISEASADNQYCDACREIDRYFLSMCFYSSGRTVWKIGILEQRTYL